MTRNEFLDNINSWWELIEFCNDEDCDVCEEIVDEDQKNDGVNADLCDEARRTDWKDIRNWLNDIPVGYEYYRCDGMFDYVPMNNGSDFQEYKDAVLEWMDDGGYWDDEEEEYPEDVIDDEPFEEDDEEDEEDEEDGSIDEDEFLAVLGRVV